jgi:hypothetical protein
MVIHDAPLAALQAQPAATPTETVPVPPAAGTFCDGGDKAIAQPGACVTVMVCPAIVSVPERDGPSVAAIVNVTLPDPFPLAPDVSVIHGTLLTALQAHPAAAATFTDRAPPEGSAANVSGATSKLHPGDCVTVKSWPATVNVPVRDGPLVGATVNGTVPFPVPAVVPIEVHGTSLDAVHGHPGPVVTATTLDPPAAPAANDVGAIVKVQPSAWETLKRRPATVIVPARGGPVVGATANATGPDPLPLAPAVIEIQSVSELAVHVQRVLDARTVTLPVPPTWPNDVDVLLNSKRQSPAACVTWARWPFTITPPFRATGSLLAAALN